MQSIRKHHRYIAFELTLHDVPMIRINVHDFIQCIYEPDGYIYGLKLNLN